MAAVKTRHTKPELVVQKLLRRMGHRFELHADKLPGNPDITLRRRKCVIFVHGCFWHGHAACPRATRPTANAVFWKKKIEGNMRRDARTKGKLKSMGWKVLEIWSCKKDLIVLTRRIEKFLFRGNIR